jgi:GNAT superfamily N-acetyltransferase
MGASEGLLVRRLASGDVAPIRAALLRLGWDAPIERYEGWLREEAAGTRAALVAERGGGFVGHVAVVRHSPYPPFAAQRIPEIRNVAVLPQARRQGVATALLDRAEALASRWGGRVGIGFGADRDYGAAQVLHVRRGYAPDGAGLTSHGRPIAFGDVVTVDDELVLHLTKKL